MTAPRLAPINVAFRMLGVRPVEHSELEETRRDLVAMLTALEGHRGCTFTVQWLAYPSAGHPLGGRIEVAVIATMPGGSSAATVEEIADDVDDVLNGPPGLWVFERVTDDLSTDRILNPFDATHVAEIARREEGLPGDGEGDLYVATLGQYL